MPSLLLLLLILLLDHSLWRLLFHVTSILTQIIGFGWIIGKFLNWHKLDVDQLKWTRTPDLAWLETTMERYTRKTIRVQNSTIIDQSFDSIESSNNSDWTEAK